MSKRLKASKEWRFVGRLEVFLGLLFYSLAPRFVAFLCFCLFGVLIRVSICLVCNVALISLFSFFPIQKSSFLHRLSLV